MVHKLKTRWEVKIKIPEILLEKAEDPLLKESLIFLFNLFKKNTYSILNISNNEITNSGDINAIIKLANELKLLKDFKGFKAHCKEYLKDIDSATLTRKFALTIFKDVEELEFEPELTTGKKADLKFSYLNQPIFIETKTFSKEFYDNAIKEHKELLKLISPIFKSELNINIEYDTYPNKNELVEWISFLQNIDTAKVRNGYLCEKNNFRVSLSKIDTNVPTTGKRVITSIHGKWDDAISSSKTPTSLFWYNSSNICFEGPKFNFEDKFEKKMKEAKKQIDPQHCAIVLISTNQALGNMNINKERIKAIFNKGFYTRYTGICLAFSLENKFDLETIWNENAKHNMSPQAEKLFNY